LRNSEEGIFVPWTMTGYDPTTRHRLRVPIESIEEFATSVEPIHFLSKDEIGKFKRFFSNREFGLLETLMLMFVRYADSCIAVIAISQSPLLNISEQELSELGEDIELQVAEMLYKSRIARIRAFDTIGIGKRDDIASELFEQAQQVVESGRMLTVILADFSKLIESVVKDNKDIDAYRIMQDVLRIIATMVTPDGKVFDLERNRALFTVIPEDGTDEELLLHQITHFMSSLFNIDLTGTLIPRRTLEFPEEIVDADTLVKEVLDLRI